MAIGLGKLENERLSRILQATNGLVTVSEAAQILSCSNGSASKVLSKLTKKGWFARVSQGVYQYIPLEVESNDFIPEDPLLIATKLFSPCYISGWSAAEYWGLTDQIFQSTIVVTGTPQKKYKLTTNKISFIIFLSKENRFFGLTTKWHANSKVLIADPSRLIADLMLNPKMAGGIRHCIDILKAYLKSDSKDVETLVSYMELLNSGSAFKRLGYLVEQCAEGEICLIETCLMSINTGRTKIDPQSDCQKYVKKWRLNIPNNWNDS